MNSLEEWLAYQQRQHPREVALGLERVRSVAQRLVLERPARVVLTVGGTNGKGSTVAFLEAMLRGAGYRVGAYTSPHLLRYNERVRIDGVDARDDELLAAFERIEGARGEVPLTYFEYATLAALLLFAGNVDVAILEVGLGGRLDAVNLVDADAALVTTVDLDHREYLGDDRESIGYEKAGIFRPGRPAIVAEHDPPQALLRHARAIGARLVRAGTDFETRADAGGEWHWQHRDGSRYTLPLPLLSSPSQLANAAGAIAMLHALADRLEVSEQAIATGVAQAWLPARLQRFEGPIEVLVDVGHNPQAARELARWLQLHPAPGTTRAVFAALGDKDIEGIVAPLASHIAQWHVAGLQQDSPRGIAAAALAARCLAAAPAAEVRQHDRVDAALAAARAASAPGDRVLAFGSFLTAAAVLRAMG